MKRLITFTLLLLAACNSSAPRPPSPQTIAYNQFVIDLFAGTPPEPVEINDLIFVDQDLEDETLFQTLLK